MAKLGNESRLILKLAAERMSQKEKAVRQNDERQQMWRLGYNAAYHEFLQTLQDISSELERG